MIKMGTGSSKSVVKTIRVTGERLIRDVETPSDEVSRQEDRSEVKILTPNQPGPLFGCIPDPENEIYEQDVETQLLNRKVEEAEKRARTAESQILLDRSAPIHEQIAALKRELISLQGHTHTANQTTALAHSQVVTKLESELRTAAEEMISMRSRYEKKIRRLRMTSAKAKAESQLTVMTLSEENSRLMEENANLLACIDDYKRKGYQKEMFTKPSDSQEDEQVDPRTKLIIELSHQVSELDEELRRAQSKITELESSRRRCTFSATSGTSQCDDTKKPSHRRTSKDNWSVSKDSLLDDM
jgi:hypothetical protein